MVIKWNLNGGLYNNITQSISAFAFRLPELRLSAVWFKSQWRIFNASVWKLVPLVQSKDEWSHGAGNTHMTEPDEGSTEALNQSNRLASSPDISVMQYLEENRRKKVFNTLNRPTDVSGFTVEQSTERSLLCFTAPL